MSDDFFGTNGVDRDELDSQPVVDAPGWYHFEVTEVTPELDTLNKKGKERAPCFTLRCTVVHSVEGQSPAGRVLYHRLYVGASGGGPPAEGAIKSNLRFLTGVGALRWVDVDGRTMAVDPVTNKASVGRDTIMRCKGRHFIAPVEKEESKNTEYKDRHVIPFGRAYKIGDPKVSSVPYNKEMIAAVLGESAGSGQGGEDVPADF
jgi:hypothetical protein